MLSFLIMSIASNPYESISTALDTNFIGRRIIYFPQLSSTMDIARQEARKGAAEGTVIITGEQIGGRGRNRRTWLTPPGNIALSVILYPDVAWLPYLIMLASLAVTRSIRSVTGLKADIKWPNDILIGGKKVCGILIENEITGDNTTRAIIGIGININVEESEIKGSSVPVTSLEKETRQVVAKAYLVSQLLGELERLYSRLPDGSEIFEEWRANLITLGKRVVVTTGKENLEGTADSVDASGALVLKLDDGSSAKVVAGDVTLREK
jgi:BirA family biotin operon repressor/biotin-[acetyl-CoA-carboxylase] ligase